jgi:hypothetical protein
MLPKTTTELLQNTAILSKYNNHFRHSVSTIAQSVHRNKLPSVPIIQRAEKQYSFGLMQL